MPKQTYNLLSVERVPGAKPPYRFTGTLANQGVDIGEKHPIAAQAAGLLLRTTRKAEAPLLTLEFEVDEEARTWEARAVGPLAHLVGQRLERLRARVDSLGRPVAAWEGGLVYNLYQPRVPSAELVNHMSRLVMVGRDPLWPTACTLQVTAGCQLDCYHCSAAKYRTARREELSTEEWKGVIAQAQDIGCYSIVLTGGEPLMRRDLCELIASVDRDRAHVAVFSNGLLLTDEMAARLREAGLCALMVSIDDPRPEVHDSLRGLKGAFDKGIAAMRRGLEAGLLVGLSTYASPADVREGRVEELIELGKQIGVHEVTVFDVVPTGKLLPLDEKKLLTAEDKESLVALGRRYQQLDDYPNVVTQSEVEGPEGSGCMGASEQFYMTAFGDVDPCDFMPLTFGNIRDESLQDIWQRMREFPAFAHHCDHCLMQDPEFRRQYIDDIPDDRLLPWPACDSLRDRPHGPPAEKIASCRAALPKERVRKT